MRCATAAALAWLFLIPLFAEGFPSRTVEIPLGESTLVTKVYVFDTLDEGERIAESVYGIRNLKGIVSSGTFRYLRPLLVGREIEGHSYGMFRYGHEFWILKNEDDAKLYGMGRFIKTRSIP